MKTVLIIILLLGSKHAPAQTIPEPICLRLNYFFSLKHRTAEKFWKGFDKKLLFGPMIYYAPEGSYVINPNKKLGKKLNYRNIANCLYKGNIAVISSRIDTAHFNMQVDYDEEDTALLHYYNAIASVSDLNIAKIFVPKIRNIEEWIGMMLHESFHLYQTSFPKFKSYQNSTQEKLSRDTLIAFYNNEEWFKASIEKEYDLLLHAINTNNIQQIVVYIENFLNSRDQRYKKITVKYGIDIRPLEDMLERSEGVARYMEYCMKRVVKEFKINAALEKTDSLYHPGNYAHYEIASDAFMNKLSSQYYYAMGTNLAWLMELHKIDIHNMYRDNIAFENYLKKIR